MIRAWHFSLYTAIVSCPYPEVKQNVAYDADTTVELNDVKGVKIHFPSYSLNENFEASVKVFYADDPSATDYENIEQETKEGNALATPIVMLGPHGTKFNKDINVQLPLPDCDQIMRQFGLNPKTSLTVYHSSTGEDEPLKWELCEVKYEIVQDANGNFMISFPVRHFSWYKAMWDILASTVHGAKVGVSYFYPYIRFAMMCTAMMDETADTRSFGLEVTL